MKTEIFNFIIPDHLIAQTPKANRSDSRLLVYRRDSDEIIDSFTRDIGNFLDENCFLVFNNSRVIPARIKVTKKENNREGEFLTLRLIDKNNIEVLTDKTKKYGLNTKVIMPDGTEAVVTGEPDGLVKLIHSDKDIFDTGYFERYGAVPLPPYIKKGIADEFDRDRYQTIYKKYYGSAAAPTAGLHFDDRIFGSLSQKNIGYGFVSLHVGLGTFQPIYAENIEEHRIHKEEYSIDCDEAVRINDAIAKKKKIIPVGTTSLRTLETAFSNGQIREGKGVSDIYIYPPYEFKVAGGLFTNFHTPKSSLAVLVSSMVGVEKLLSIYRYAVKKEYRFFSYGDAMLIL
jgi:S-adenosylmethionine:tRNA ribosyltransferase-isomerase